MPRLQITALSSIAFVEPTIEDMEPRFLLQEWQDQIFASLSTMERDIISLRFGLGEVGEELTLAQLSQKFNCSPQNIHRIEKKAIEKLREQLSGSRNSNKD